jgi:hypothetical protein
LSTQAATAILILPLSQAQNNPIGKAESKSKRKGKKKGKGKKERKQKGHP